MKTASEYIEKVYGTATFARALQLNDAVSIMDLMDDYASKYANQKLDEAAEKATAHTESRFPSVHYCECHPVVNKQSILSLKD